MDFTDKLSALDGDTVARSMYRESTLTVSMNTRVKELAKERADEIRETGGITDYVTYLILFDLQNAGKLKNGLNNE